MLRSDLPRQPRIISLLEGQLTSKLNYIWDFNFLSPRDLIYSQVLGIRTWAWLRGRGWHFSVSFRVPDALWHFAPTHLQCLSHGGSAEEPGDG